MAVIVDIPGVGQVEAKNAATESTLRELVNAMKGMSGGGRSAAGGAGAGAAGGMLSGLSKATQDAGKSAKGFTSSTAGGAKTMSNAAGNAGKALGKGLTGAAGLATKSVFGVANAAKQGADLLAGLAAASAKLISDFANVGNSLTSAAGALAPIPIIGPALSTTLGAVAQAATGAADAFTQASASGATFGGSINEMARSASEAGMTLDQFAGLIAANGEGMLAFGATTEGGAKQFSRLSRDLRSAGSDLYALGYSTEQINDGLAKYGSLLRAQGLQGKQSNAQLVSGAKNYLKQLDALAKISGEERSAKEAQMKALATDAQFQMAMAGKSEKVRSSFMNLVGGFGPTLGGFVKDFVATGTTTTKESQDIAAALGSETMAELTKLRHKLNSEQELTADEQDRLRAIIKKSSEAGSKSLGTALAANRDSDTMSKAFIEGMQINVGAVKKTADEQDKAASQTDKMNEQVRKSQEALAAFSNSFQMALANSGMLNLLMDAFSFLANIVQTFVIPAFNFLTPILSKMFYGIQALAMPIIEKFSGSMGGLEGTVTFIDNLMNTVFEALGGVIRGGMLAFDGLKDGVMVLFEPLKRMYESIFGVSDSTATFGQTMIKVGSFLGDVFRVLGEVIGWVVDAMQPLWKIIGALVSAFVGMIDFFVNFDDYKTDLQETMQSLIDGMLRMLNKITFGAAGISEDEYNEREKAREEAKEDRLEAKKAAEKAQVEGLKQDKKEFENRKLSVAKLGGINKEEAAVRKDALKGKDEATKNLNDPIQLLMAEAKQQKSGLIKTPEGQSVAKPGEVKTPTGTAAAAAQGAKAAVEAKAEEKAAEENKAKEAAKPTTTPTETPASPTPGQTSGPTAIAQLNTNIEELVRLMRINNNLTSEQASGLSRLAGSVTGDLFQV